MHTPRPPRLKREALTSLDLQKPGTLLAALIIGGVLHHPHTLPVPPPAAAAPSWMKQAVKAQAQAADAGADAESDAPEQEQPAC